MAKNYKAKCLKCDTLVSTAKFLRLCIKHEVELQKKIELGDF